ncbi:MAG: EscU/YscU/HrcU family type III secretion system export apparatus switch protein, partial [Pseudomonadales bacterium]
RAHLIAMEDTRPKRAVALEYDGTNAPRITALGSDALALRIVEIAREHGIPLLENHELAGLLSQLDLGDEIPETLYLCVAQIIAFAYRLRGRVPQDWNPAGNNMAGSETPASEQTLALPPALS